MTVLPGDLPVFRNKWCGLSGDLSVTLVLGIMCHHTSCMGGSLPKDGVPRISCAPTPAESVLRRGGRKTTVLSLRRSLLRAAVLSRGPPHLGVLQPCRGLLVACLLPSGVVSILFHVPLLFSLRYNSHIINFTLLQCTMLWILV